MTVYHINSFFKKLLALNKFKKDMNLFFESTLHKQNNTENNPNKLLLTHSLRQAGAVSKKIFDCFFLVFWVHLNDIYQILGGWFTRCLETSMYHILQKWTILNQCFLFFGAFIRSNIITWNGKYGKNASSIIFASVQSPYMYQIKCKYGRLYP